MESFEMLFHFVSKSIQNGQKYENYFLSIIQKLRAHNYFLSQMNKYHEIVKKEFNMEWDHHSIKSLQSTRILSAYFEALLNNDYSVMENLAKITPLFFPKVKSPYSFNDQLNWFLKEENFSLDLDYSKYLKSNLGWYAKLKEARDEPVHFLSGFIIFDTDNGGNLVPKYYNQINNPRQKVFFQGKSIDLDLDFAKELGKEISYFLSFYGNHFLSKMDPSTEISFYVFPDAQEEIKIKLGDFLSGKIKLTENSELF